MASDRPPIFLFDGDCGFCSSAAGAMERWIPSPTAIRPWQRVALPPLGVAEAEADQSVVMVDVAGRRTHGPEAVAALLRTSPSGAWRAAGALLGLRPVLALAWPVYHLISRNRHRLPGGTPACALPHAER